MPRALKNLDISLGLAVRFEPEELKAFEQASASALAIDAFVPEGAADRVQNCRTKGRDFSEYRITRPTAQAAA